MGVARKAQYRGEKGKRSGSAFRLEVCDLALHLNFADVISVVLIFHSVKRRAPVINTTSIPLAREGGAHGAGHLDTERPIIILPAVVPASPGPIRWFIIYVVFRICLMVSG